MTDYMKEAEARKRIAHVKTLFDARLFVPQGYRSPEKNVKMLAWLVQQEVGDFDNLPTPRTEEDMAIAVSLVRQIARIDLSRTVYETA